jgi:hypothetical protein
MCLRFKLAMMAKEKKIKRSRELGVSNKMKIRLGGEMLFLREVDLLSIGMREALGKKSGMKKLINLQISPIVIDAESMVILSGIAGGDKRMGDKILRLPEISL